MPLRSSQLVFVGLSSAALTFAVIFGAVYWMDRPTTAASSQRTTIELAKATCLAVTGQMSAKDLANYSPAQICDCVFNQIYAQMPADLQAYYVRQYELAETEAPTDPVARDQYDKTFPARFKNVLDAAKRAHAPGEDSAAKFGNDLKTANFGPICNNLIFGQPNR